MRKLLLFFLVAAPALAAQSLITISPQQCVWRASDDPAWAAPSFDDSGWQPLAQFKLPDQPRFWVRCHADLSLLHTLAHPALQIQFNTAYQVYLDGGLKASQKFIRRYWQKDIAIAETPADPKHSTRRSRELKGLTGFIGVKSHAPAERNSDIVSVPFGNLGGFGPA